MKNAEKVADATMANNRVEAGYRKEDRARAKERDDALKNLNW